MSLPEWFNIKNTMLLYGGFVIALSIPAEQGWSTHWLFTMTSDSLTFVLALMFVVFYVDIRFEELSDSQ